VVLSRASLHYFGRFRKFRGIATGSDTLLRSCRVKPARSTSNFTISSDGRSLIFVHVDQQVSELMLIDNFR
jgi:hypothetical protein